MRQETLRKIIRVASGRIPADLVIKNGMIADVYGGKFIKADLAIADGFIAGTGSYEGREVMDAMGEYVLPGFIDGHIHIESSYVSPHELGKLLVVHGATTIIADPHEIVNVCGRKGFEYMRNAAKETKLDIKFMIPSCVPTTLFETAGADIKASDMNDIILEDNVLGLGEFMNYLGVIHADEMVLEKLLLAKQYKKMIDGHSPGVLDKNLNAYVAAGIKTDHECSYVEEMQQRISCGMYVQLRQGSACHNLRALAKGITKENSSRCLLCSDDRQPKTIFEEGHIDAMLRMCIEEGIDPMTAIQMATVNAANCYGLEDRGAITPGKRADIVLVNNVNEFKVSRVFIQGELVAREGNYLPATKNYPIDSVYGCMNVKNFSRERLHMNLNSDNVHVIKMMPDGVLTQKVIRKIQRDETGDFIYNPQNDIVKIAVVERHCNTGNVSVGLLEGYGIKKGAVALSIAHDSHNIIVVGTNDEDMTKAVEYLIKMEGGIALVQDGELLESMPLPIAGLMSDQNGEWVDQKLNAIHKTAFNVLGIQREVEPVMTLCFMALPVIPELKITDKGLFDVGQFSFISVEAQP